MIKNWQLISLIDVDAKIACKTLAKHLGNVLTEIMHSNQNAFVKEDLFLMQSQQLMICGVYQKRRNHLEV